MGAARATYQTVQHRNKMISRRADCATPTPSVLKEPTLVFCTYLIILVLLLQSHNHTLTPGVR